MSWNIAQAKQCFSEVVKRAATEPQLIFNRDRLVAAVIDAEQFSAFNRWREDRINPAAANVAISAEIDAAK